MDMHAVGEVVTHAHLHMCDCCILLTKSLFINSGGLIVMSELDPIRFFILTIFPKLTPYKYIGLQLPESQQCQSVWGYARLKEIRFVLHVNLVIV